MTKDSELDLTALLTPRHDGIDLDHVRGLVEAEAEIYRRRTPKSRALADRASKHLLGGVMSSWHSDWHLPHPLYVERSQGNRVWDVDGNEYIDFNFGDTPDMFGHAPDNAVTRRMQQVIFEGPDAAGQVVNSARRQQGLHQLYRDFCGGPDGCDRCVLYLASRARKPLPAL